MDLARVEFLYCSYLGTFQLNVLEIYSNVIPASMYIHAHTTHFYDREGDGSGIAL